MKVIGAGFGRTGTLSLKRALEQLGFGPCYHMFEVLQAPQRAFAWARIADGEPPDWDAVFAGYVSTTDWPACSYYAELAEHYPESKVILTTRDPESWYDSMKSTVAARDTRSRVRADLPGDAPLEEMEQMFARVSADYEAPTREAVVARFEQHAREVRARIPAERLLDFDVRDGWVPLCRFLQVPVPEAPFPRTNSRGAFELPKAAPK